jgi:DNA repair protein RecO (recombination protein O)
VRQLRCEAFILGTHPLRERDRIVAFLTRDAGQKRGVARGARNPQSAFGGALEPMTEARILYFEKEGRELVSIDSVDVVRSSFPLSSELAPALLVSALAESLQTFVSDSDPAEPFYRLARHAMDALFAGAPAEAVSAYFDLWILKLSGLFPSVKECAGCGRPLEPDEPLMFDAGRPGSVALECRRGAILRRPAPGRRTLLAFLSAPLDPGGDREGVAEVSAVARRARRHFLGHELKSQKVLAEALE